MAVEFREAMSSALGLNACSLDLLALIPHLTLLLLFVSVSVRYRGVIAFKYYEKRNTRPTRYCTITALPYEALLGFLILVVPRGIWLYDAIRSAIINDNAWEHRHLDGVLGWAFVVIITFFDFAERRRFTSRLLMPYAAMKAKSLTRQSVPTKEESEDSRFGEQDVEANKQAPAETQATKTWRSRVHLMFAPRMPEPTAANVLSQMHVLAFMKVALTFVFTSELALFLCDGFMSEMIFDFSQSLVIPLTIVSVLNIERSLELLLLSRWFAQTEMGWDGLSGHDHQIHI